MIMFVAVVFCASLSYGYYYSRYHINHHSFSAEPVLRSRIQGEKENHLQELLYKSYSGEDIANYFDQFPIAVLGRIIEIGTPVLNWWVMRKIDFMTSFMSSSKEREKRNNRRAVQLRDAIVKGKSVTFIKSGQALALRPDIIKDPFYIAQLQTLQDEVGTFDNAEAFDLIADELGEEVENIFKFDPHVPIASASIGQVYKGVLKSTNSTVAVKVQRPDAIRKVGVDLYILRNLAEYFKRRYKLRSDMVGIVDEFGEKLFEELNYVQEAANCQRFKSLYGNIPGIYVPDVYLNYTSRRVLTMEFVEGTKGPWKNGGEKLLTVGLQCSVLQLLGTGFFHSDPHRGNLLQTPSGDLAYLDFGMMAEVPSSKRYAMIGSVLGLVNKDISLVIESMNELEFFPPGTDTTTIVSVLTAALQNSTDTGGASALNFTKLNQNLNAISDKLPFRLPPYYTMIIRSLTILEGLALFVDPEFRLVRGAYPFVARQILASPTPEMSKLLSSVLLTGDKKQNINWAQLEQFVSISAKADAAMQGDFSALKSAQEQGDIMKVYMPTATTTSGINGGAKKREEKAEENQAAVTVEVATLILQYLLSERGSYLRGPLVNDVADIVDQLGLTTQSFLSLISNQLLPPPTQKPDRFKVLQFLNIANGLLAARLQQQSASSQPKSARSTIVISRLRLLGQVMKWLLYRLAPLQQVGLTTSVKKQQQAVQGEVQVAVLLLLDGVAALLGQVAAELVERRARESARAVFSPQRVTRGLPLLSRVVDLLPQ